MKNPAWRTMAQVGLRHAEKVPKGNPWRMPPAPRDLPHGAPMAHGAALRHFAASFPDRSEAYKASISRVAQSWDELDEMLIRL
jgi:hypothetical protein